jgi:hypothetical protein
MEALSRPHAAVAKSKKTTAHLAAIAGDVSTADMQNTEEV